MSERDDKTPPGRPGRELRCDEWENLIADALDENLPAADAAAFARHHQHCALCAQMLKETEQGKAWMEYLAVEPELPDGLLAKILTRTSEPLAPGAGVALPVHPAPVRPAWRGARLPQVHAGARQVARQVFEPRLMMTLAMAFFSIALTLNLAGIRLTEVHAADLRPARMRATLTRQYYSTNEQVVKYYENLRLVYEMEARVRELRRSTEAEPASVESPRPSPDTAPRRQDRDGTGIPSSTAPSGGEFPPAPQVPRSPSEKETALPAMMVRATPGSAGNPPPAQLTARFERARSGQAGKREKVMRQAFTAPRPTTEDQAERSWV